jgi:hypothetical protein
MFKNNLYIIFFLLVFIYGCSSSTDDIRDNDIEKQDIFEVAKEEQKNKMYSKESDSTVAYWSNNKIIRAGNHTKCNIYALNTLYKAGYLCPKEYILTKDLFDTAKFDDILKIIKINKNSEILSGDLVVWNGHVIIFQKLLILNNTEYALAYWAGTSQPDNGEEIINNVKYGKYKLEGYFIIRRPKKRI